MIPWTLLRYDTISRRSRVLSLYNRLIASGLVRLTVSCRYGTERNEKRREEAKSVEFEQRDRKTTKERGEGGRSG